MKTLTLVIIIFLVGPCSTIASSAQTARQIAQRTFSSVVLVVTQDSRGQPLALGSGFFVAPNVVVTNLHVIKDAERAYSKIVGENIKRDVLGTVATDAAHDLALLQVTGTKAPKLTLGDSRQIAVGDEVYAVGNPRGLEGTFSQGIVSGIRELGRDKVLQITAPISPGSSGGPVLNAHGEVIGVAAAAFKDSQNLNFAIPSSYVAALVSKSGPVSPLSASSGAGVRESVLDDLGGHATSGVVGTALSWEMRYDGLVPEAKFAFTLRNQLQQTVKNVYCLVIFYDASDNPLDVEEVSYDGAIPGGLGKRVRGSVDQSVKKLTTEGDPLGTYHSDTPSTKVEFKVLDFQIVE